MTKNAQNLLKPGHVHIKLTCTRSASLTFNLGLPMEQFETKSKAANHVGN